VAPISASAQGEGRLLTAGARVTVKESVVVFVKLPEIPVIVTVTVLVVAVPLALSVNVLLLAVLVGLNDAVTPEGIQLRTVDIDVRHCWSRALVSRADNGAPNWSRDGKWIYFYSLHEKGPFQLWKVPLGAGGGSVRLSCGLDPQFDRSKSKEHGQTQLCPEPAARTTPPPRRCLW
jgi:WD40-like Beta Propeller Repeat